MAMKQVNGIIWSFWLSIKVRASQMYVMKFQFCEKLNVVATLRILICVNPKKSGKDVSNFHKLRLKDDISK